MPPRPGVLGQQRQRGGVLGMPPQQQRGRQPSILDRILGLYGADPATHIPEGQQRNVLKQGLMDAGIQGMQMQGRGHDAPTLMQTLGAGLGVMRQAGPRYAAQQQQNQVRQMLQSGQMSPEQLQAAMQELLAMGRVDEAKVIQQALGDMGGSGFTLSPGQTRFTAEGTPIAYSPAPGSPFEGLTKMDRGDTIAFLNADGEIEREYNKVDAAGLRKDYNDEIAEYMDVAQRLATVETAAIDPSAAGDIAMVFAFMKVLDPTSVVRESEYATARNAAGIPDRIRALWNRLVDGDQLAPAQRADFLHRARLLGRDRQQAMQPTLQRYRGMADRMGADPRDVIHDPYEAFDFSSVPFEQYPFQSGSVAERRKRYVGAAGDAGLGQDEYDAAMDAYMAGEGPMPTPPGGQ